MPLSRIILLTLLAILVVAAPASGDTRSFPNTTALTVPGSGTQGPASLYPSSVNVSGMVGPVTDVNVTLHRFGHELPADVRVLLVSPTGRTARVMSSSCGAEVEDFTWIFDDQAASGMTGACDQFVYRPSGGVGSSNWAPPAPPGAYGLDFGVFNHRQANGEWKLYVEDIASQDTGDIEGGWTLTVTTGPVNAAIPGTGTSGTANPYPINRTVSGESGVITEMSVHVEGIWHERPDDIDMLLVGPRGQKVMLMSDACGTFDVNAFGWVWQDDAPALMPDGDATNTCGTPNHRPTDHEPGESLPGPAPPRPYDAALSVLDHTDPNGEWRLFVSDDSSGEVGFFTNQFLLGFTTRPKANTRFTQNAITLAEGETKTLTVSRPSPADNGPATVTVTTVPVSATSGADFTPVATVLNFAADEQVKNVNISALADAAAEEDETFAVTLSAPTGDAAVAPPSSVAVTIPAPPAPPAPPASPTAQAPPSVTPAPPAARRAARPLCAGRRATIVGTRRRDVLRGTRRADVIAALAGNDVVRGGGGNDVICGGPGRDRLLGGAGRDRLVGGTGRDTCLGGTGRDRATCERRSQL